MTDSMTDPVAKGHTPESAPADRGWLQLLGRVVSLFGVLGLMAGLSVGLKVLFDPQVMPIQVARIEGELRYLKREDLEKVVADATQASFFGVNVGSVKESIELLPWVARASVRRVWPDTLHIWVQEQVPVARWNEGSVINAQGGIFTPPEDSIPKDLPQLAGPHGSGTQVLARYQAMQKQLAAVGMDIRSLSMSGRGAWQLETSEGIHIQLGQEAASERLAWWVDLYPGLKASRPQESMYKVDICYGNGMAVLWQPQAQGSAPGQSPG